ncbi:helix-turn-helix domain-containing protein [Actinomadura hibisca]|uniref:helix-turn-helix domain-containing protein n=1 Tax=Actinomadura hibisca TaxID=68565 RepID=UPI000A065416|nr:helix-turn-helix transcriptional regulator [Actinomadura hibisca]
MPAPVPIDPRTSLRAQFAHTLRVLRELKGLSQSALAKELITTREVIASYENRRNTPDHNFCVKADEFFGTGEMLQGLRHHMQREHVASWFELYLPHEGEASEIRTFQPAYIPGLLQTEAYMRADARPSNLVEEGITKRLARAKLLRRDDPPHLFAVLDEAVIMRPIGGAAVMREQLAHLLEMAALPHVHIQVVRMTQGWHYGLDGAVVVLAKRDCTRVGYVEAQFGGRLIEDPPEAARLGLMFDEIRGMALSEPASLALIRRVMEAMLDDDPLAEE